jgi:tetratricopeptide (TPR) repeat protein
VSRLPLTALALCLLAAGQALAADPLGTAGRIRMFAFANCGAPIIQQIEGACDPAPVADSLPAQDRAQAHLKHAVALVGFGRIDQAYDATDDALRADNRYADALVFRARLALARMMGDDIVRDLNAGLLVAPDNPYLLATRAEYVLENGDPCSALPAVSKALEQRPDDVDILWIKGRTPTWPSTSSTRRSSTSTAPSSSSPTSASGYSARSSTCGEARLRTRWPTPTFCWWRVRPTCRRSSYVP